MKRSCEVRLLPQAEEDLLDIIDYISQDNPGAAEKMATRFESGFALLSKNPMAGTRARESRLRMLQYRYLIIDHYLIFYQFRGGRVIILRILHGARDYQSIL
jgi:toxin ParE1/3/4